MSGRGVLFKGVEMGNTMSWGKLEQIAGDSYVLVAEVVVLTRWFEYLLRITSSPSPVIREYYPRGKRRRTVACRGT